MMSSPTPRAYAVVHQEYEMRFYAESATLLDRVLALEVVAQLPAHRISSETKLQSMRKALLEERWADALVAWIDEKGSGVDVFNEPPDAWSADAKIWTEEELPADRMLFQLEKSPLFAPSRSD